MHIMKLKVQYMVADIVMYLWVSYFELGYVGAAHRAVGFLYLVFVDGCVFFDTGSTERVVAVRDKDIGGGKFIKTERTFATRSIFCNCEVVY